MQEEVIWFQLHELWLDVGGRGRGAVQFGDAVILVDDDSQQDERVGVAQLVEWRTVEGRRFSTWQ